MRTAPLPETPNLPFRLGRHIEHDDRSWNYRVQPTRSTPATVLWRHYGSVLNQKNLGSCTGNALTQCLVTGPLRKRTWRASERKAVQLYELATTLDDVPGQYPPTDTGSSGLAVAKAAKQLGWIDSYQHAFGINDAKLAIADGPLICGTEWTEDMFNTSVAGFVSPTGSVAGGHEYLMLGYDPVDDYFTFQNSWGKSWGVSVRGSTTGGAFLMHGPDFAKLLANGGDITMPRRA